MQQNPHAFCSTLSPFIRYFFPTGVIKINLHQTRIHLRCRNINRLLPGRSPSMDRFPFLVRTSFFVPVEEDQSLSVSHHTVIHQSLHTSFYVFITNPPTLKSSLTYCNVLINGTKIYGKEYCEIFMDNKQP